MEMEVSLHPLCPLSSNPSDARSPACACFHAHQHRIEGDNSFAHRQTAWHVGEEAFDDFPNIIADDGVRWAHHADIGDIGCSLWQDTSINGYHMCVSAHNGADPSLQLSP